jgi:hypothetical protein
MKRQLWWWWGRAIMVVMAMVATTTTACGVSPPDRIEIVPRSRFRATHPGAEHRLRVDVFRGVRPLPGEWPALRWTSSDVSVARVDPQGVVTATGSGRATITAALPGAGGREVVDSVDVDNTFVAAVDIDGPFPTSLRVQDDPVQLKVIVRDEKGNPVPKPLLQYGSTGPCVEVRPDGMVFPMERGACSIVVTCADVTTRVDVKVRG